MNLTETKYLCDHCGKKLPTHSNHLAIVTSKNDDSRNWSRLHVTIERHHGIHNDAEIEAADLCKGCAVKLLTDALKRVKAGERLSKGFGSINMLTFDQTF